MPEDLDGLLETKPEPNTASGRRGSTPKSSTQNQSQTAANFLSPVGAVVAIVCFFLPWIRIECSRNDVRFVSGAEIGDILWLVLASAAVILGSFFYFRSLGNVEKARPIITIGALTGLGVILYKYVQVFRDTKSGISAKDLGMSIQPGAIGTLVGLVLSLIGALTLRKSNAIEIRVEREQPRFCGNCGSSLADDAEFCGNCGTRVD